MMAHSLPVTLGVLGVMFVTGWLLTGALTMLEVRLRTQ